MQGGKGREQGCSGCTMLHKLGWEKLPTEEGAVQVSYRGLLLYIGNCSADLFTSRVMAHRVTCLGLLVFSLIGSRGRLKNTLVSMNASMKQTQWQKETCL